MMAGCRRTVHRDVYAVRIAAILVVWDWLRFDAHHIAGTWYLRMLVVRRIVRLERRGGRMRQ